MNPTLKDPAVPDTYLVNGAYQPWVVIATGELRRFDLLHAAGSPYRLELELRTAIGAGAPATDRLCKLYLIALDGVYLPQPRPVDFLALLAGQRASLLLTCSRPGIYFLQSHANHTARPADGFGPAYVRYEQNFVTVVVSGPAGDSPPLPDLSLIPHAASLEDLQPLAGTAVSRWEMSTDQRGAPPYTSWLGVGQNCSVDAARSEALCKYAPFRGAQLAPDGAYRHTAHGGADSVEEVAVYGRWRTQAGMHLQAGPVQVVGYQPFAGGSPDAFALWWGQLGDWRDTLPTLPGVLLVRYKVRD